MIIPTSQQLRNVDSYNGVLETAAIVNNAGIHEIRQKTYQNPIDIVEGCVATIRFDQDLKRMILSGQQDLSAAALRFGARRTSAFTRRLNDTASSLVRSNGDLGLFKVTQSAEARQRARLKAFIKRWLRQIDGDLKELGVNYYEDGDFSIFCVAGIALVRDNTTNRVYSVFDSNPCKEARDFLRTIGFSRSGTNQLWIIDTPAGANFTEMVNNFYLGIRAAYHVEALANNRKVRAISSATAAL